MGALCKKMFKFVGASECGHLFLLLLGLMTLSQIGLSGAVPARCFRKGICVAAWCLQCGTDGLLTERTLRSGYAREDDPLQLHSVRSRHVVGRHRPRIGLPGFSELWRKLTKGGGWGLRGAWRAFPIYAIGAGFWNCDRRRLGTLRAMQNVLWLP